MLELTLENSGPGVARAKVTPLLAGEKHPHYPGAFVWHRADELALELSRPSCGALVHAETTRRQG